MDDEPEADTEHYAGVSSLQIQVAAPLRIDIQLCDDALRGPSEWARLSAAVVEADASPPDEYDTRALALLSRLTGWPIDQLTAWLQEWGQPVPDAATGDGHDMGTMGDMGAKDGMMMSGMMCFIRNILP